MFHCLSVLVGCDTLTLHLQLFSDIAVIRLDRLLNGRLTNDVACGGQTTLDHRTTAHGLYCSNDNAV